MNSLLTVLSTLRVLGLDKDHSGVIQFFQQVHHRGQPAPRVPGWAATTPTPSVLFFFVRKVNKETGQIPTRLGYWPDISVENRVTRNRKDGILSSRDKYPPQTWFSNLSRPRITSARATKRVFNLCCAHFSLFIICQKSSPLSKVRSNFYIDRYFNDEKFYRFENWDKGNDPPKLIARSGFHGLIEDIGYRRVTSVKYNRGIGLASA